MVSADSLVPVPAADVHAYLIDLERHWDLLPGLVDVVAADRTGAVLRLRGPLGVRRTVRTRVIRSRPPLELAGAARTPRGSVAWVAWTLTPQGDQTLVRLSAHLGGATGIDRALLALGGRAWLRRAFARAVARLGLVASRAPLPRAA